MGRKKSNAWSKMLTSTKMKTTSSEEDEKAIADKCKEVIDWLESNQEAEKSEYDSKQKELESICNPIITKLYQAGGGAPGGMPGGGMPGGGMPGGFPGAAPQGEGGSSGPTI